MRPPSTTPTIGEARSYEQGHGYGMVLFDQMFFLPAYPFWSLTIIAMDVVALWGLCAYGSRANLEAD